VSLGALAAHACPAAAVAPIGCSALNPKPPCCCCFWTAGAGHVIPASARQLRQAAGQHDTWAGHCNGHHAVMQPAPPQAATVAIHVQHACMRCNAAGQQCQCKINGARVLEVSSAARHGAHTSFAVVVRCQTTVVNMRWHCPDKLCWYPHRAPGLRSGDWRHAQLLQLLVHYKRTQDAAGITIQVPTAGGHAVHTQAQQWHHLSAGRARACRVCTRERSPAAECACGQERTVVSVGRCNSNCLHACWGEVCWHGRRC
jgi:hypothetical protein